MSLAKLFALVMLSLVGLSMLFTHLFSHPNNPDTYYDLLGVDVQSTTDQISQHYRKLVRKMHPDRQIHLSQAEREALPPYSLEQINRAYNVLSKPTKRIRYDFSLSQPSYLHHDAHMASQRDKITRIYEYQSSWDESRGSFFGSIDNILIGYSLKFPEHAKYAKQIYQSDGDDTALSEVPIKPYVLVKSTGYDNVITYHFSDFNDQLDRPRQLLINTGLVVISVISAILPFYGLCGSSAAANPEEDLTEEEKVKLQEFERAGWNMEDINKFKENQAENKRLEEHNKSVDEEIRQRNRELNKQNKLKQEQIRQEQLAKVAQKIQAAKDARETATQLDIQNNNDPFHCDSCRKSYHSQVQLNQHLESAQHKKKLKELAKKK